MRSKDATKGVGATLAETEPEDLVKFGLIPEFVGRLPVVATLRELDETALIQILTEPKNSLVKQYKKMFDLEEVDLDIRPEALSAVAKKAMERKTGARGLRSIMEQILLDVMYEVPGQDSISKVVIDDKVVNGEAEPLVMHESESKKASSED